MAFTAGAVGDGPLIVAHRGASSQAPENTLPAFNLAWDQGADAIEGDFRLTRDGHVVCLHDDNTERVFGTKRVVADSTLAELRELDVGRWRGGQWEGVGMPTLAEVLDTVPDGKKMYIELKSGVAIVSVVLAGIADAGLADDQVVLISFDACVMAACERAAPQFRTLWLSGFKRAWHGKVSPSLRTVLGTLGRAGVDGFSSCSNHVSEAFVRKVLDKGYEYHVWTVDDLTTAERFRKWGALSITTNDPERMKQGLVE